MHIDPFSSTPLYTNIRHFHGVFNGERDIWFCDWDHLSHSRPVRLGSLSPQRWPEIRPCEGGGRKKKGLLR